MSALVRAVLLAAAAIAAVLLMATYWTPRRAEIVLVPEQTFQTMSGWEATADLPDTPAAPEWAPYAEEMFDLVVDGIGINRVRLEVRSGAETRSDAATRFLAGDIGYEAWTGERYAAANDNDDPFAIDPTGFNFDELDWHVRNTVLPLRERLEARGEALLVNLCYVSFRDGSFFQMDPEEYAEFVLATFRHMDEAWGFVPDLWEVVLEPDLPDHGWTGEAMGRAMAATAKRLGENGYEPAFVAPSVTDMSHAVPYAREIQAVPGAADRWVELSYHRYRGASARTLAGIAEFARENGLRTAMLEWWFGRGTHDVLHEDLVTGDVSAWQGRVVGGLVDAAQANGGVRLSPGSDTRFNLLYFRAIRQGAVRVGAESSAPRAFAPVAFRNADGRVAVLVEASRGGEVAFADLPPGTYDVAMALPDRSEARPEPLVVAEGGTAVVRMPDEGVLSLVAR